MKKWKIRLALLAFGGSLLVWLPFMLGIKLPGWGLDFSEGMKVVFANFDGPNYIIVAKSWYEKAKIGGMFSNPLPLEYYPAHFPLYPAIVGGLDLIMAGPWAMLVATLLGTILASWMFYRLLLSIKVEGGKWLSVVFLFFPARWLIVRSVGSPEPWFVFFVLASILAYRNKKYWLAGLWGSLSVLTKSPGVLLLAGYGLDWLVRGVKDKEWRWQCWPVISMALVIPALFWYYQVQTGDFWAYFNSGDNFHLFWPPFSIFSPKGAFWTGDFWLEEIIWLWLIYGIGVLKLWKKRLTVEASFASIFWLSTLFVAHRDVARYILPVFPLVLIGWEEMVSSREFKVVAGVLLVPILLFAWNFMLNNTAPVADWTPYL